MISQSLDMIAQSLDMIAQSLDMIAQSLNDIICIPVCTMHVLLYLWSTVYLLVCNTYMYVHVRISCSALCIFPPASVSRATEGQSQPPSEEQPMEH